MVISFSCILLFFSSALHLLTLTKNSWLTFYPEQQYLILQEPFFFYVKLAKSFIGSYKIPSLLSSFEKVLKHLTCLHIFCDILTKQEIFSGFPEEVCIYSQKFRFHE